MEKTKRASLDNEGMHLITTYNNGSLAFFDDLSAIHQADVIELEIYVFAIVLKGSASLSINGSRYEIGENSLLICPPKNIVEDCVLSSDFECHCVGMSTEYLRRLVPMTENAWDLKILFEKNPVCSLSAADVDVFCQYYNLLLSKINLPSAVQEKVINTLMLAMIYDMQYLLSRIITIKVHPFTAGEQLFSRFINLMEGSYPKSRNVAWYAGQLNISPKYLSSLCRSVGGYNASYLINMYVVRDIEFQMKHSSRSIKEISNALDFPNLSFFGKYVRKHFGLSPRELREKFRRESNEDKS